MNSQSLPEPSELLKGFLKFVTRKGLALNCEPLLRDADAGLIDNVAVSDDGPDGRANRVIDSYLCGSPSATHTRNLYRKTLRVFLKEGYLAAPPGPRGNPHAR